MIDQLVGSQDRFDSECTDGHEDQSEAPSPEHHLAARRGSRCRAGELPSRQHREKRDDGGNELRDLSDEVDKHGSGPFRWERRAEVHAIRLTG